MKSNYIKLFLAFLAISILFCLSSCGSENTFKDDSQLDNSSNDKPTLENTTNNLEQNIETTDKDVEEDEEESQIPEPETFEPIHYSGSSDDVLEIDEPDGMYVFQISGNESGNHFAVKSYDENGEDLDLLVNTTDPYNGITLGSSNGAKILEISANGSWSIDLVPIYDMPLISTGETYSGSGDAVLQINNTALKADVSGNENERHFSVQSYNYNWDYIDLLVNTTDVYSGTVMLKDSPNLLFINAEDSWSITLE